MPTVPMFPLERAMLPGEELPLQIFEPRYTALVRACLDAADPSFGVVLIAAGREVGGGDTRSDVGVLARIVEHAALPADLAGPALPPGSGEGRYLLNCQMTQRFRVLEWLPDAPYPRAVIDVWDDEPGEAVSAETIRDIEDRIVALYQRIAAARGAEIDARDVVAGADDSGDASKWLYALAGRLPMGQADRYAVLAAPTVAARAAALTEAVDTVEAMVEFQLSE